VLKVENIESICFSSINADCIATSILNHWLYTFDETL
jgi:hypothetical protein